LHPWGGRGQYFSVFIGPLWGTTLLAGAAMAEREAWKWAL
jgi:hypothetical protein